MNVLLGVTGGIAAYKAPDIIRGFKAHGHTVKVVTTESALKFITSLTLAVTSENHVYTNMWEERGAIDHIALTKWADVLLIAPATANTMNKIRYGLCDNLLTTIVQAWPKHKEFFRFIAPAMNTEMYDKLRGDKDTTLPSTWHCFWAIEPRQGLLACGDVGKGAMAKPRKIVDVVCGAWETNESNRPENVR